MKELIERIERWSVIFFALAVAAVSISHVVHIEWLTERAQGLTLAILAILVAYTVPKLQRIDRNTSAAHRKSLLRELRRARRALDPNLEKVFGEHIGELSNNLIRAIREREVHLHDIDLFRYFYRRTLESFPRATFFATSLPLRSYFWSSKVMVDAMRKFTLHTHGKMTRIFFLDPGVSIDDAAVREVLDAQRDVGITVYTIESAKIPAMWRQLFVVEERGRIAWQVWTNSSNEIHEIKATSKPDTIKAYKDTIARLMNHEALMLYEGNVNRTNASPQLAT